jgi:transcriptional regulator with XRE-family HTH domain
VAVVVPANEAVPNPLLRQAREARNLTQDEVADGLMQLGAKGATGGLVSKWERGICRPNRFHRRLLCQFFDAAQEQLGLGAGATHSHAPAIGGNTVGLVANAGDAAVAARQKRSSVDPVTLDALDADVERFALECLAVPHADLFPQVWDDWQQVEQLLDTRQSLKDRVHLTLLGGQLAYFLARLSFNLADYTAARRHAALAWQYAEDVGQVVLCASVKTLQGTIAFYAGQHHRAPDCLQAAERYDNPYNRPRIAANMARVYAVLGERRDAEHALAVMERHLVDLPVQPGDSPYTSATGMSALATTLAWLGDGEIAEDYARKAVALHNRPEVRHTLFEDRGNATLNLAASLVVRQQPEPQEAARLGIEVLAVPEGQRTETVRKRGMELLELLDAWRAVPAVQDFTERLHEYRLSHPPA